MADAVLAFAPRALSAFWRGGAMAAATASFAAPSGAIPAAH